MSAQNDRISNCATCKLKEDGFLCHLTPAAAAEFESIKSSSFYPSGSTLFLENELATGSGIPYEASAEALHPSKVAFIRREDFLRFAGRFPEVYTAVTRQLNSQYARACEQLRTVGLSASAHEKVARLLLNWSSEETQTSGASQIKVPLTHEQIAECVGSTRETITRTLTEFKNKHLVTLKGTTVTIPSRSALQAVCGD